MNSTFSILAAIGLSLSTAMAQTSEQNHYKLISLENDSYRNWSKEELLNLILVNREPLIRSHCDGSESQLLPDLLHQNPRKDSLRIHSSTDHQDYIIITPQQIRDTNGNTVDLSELEDAFTLRTLEILSDLSRKKLSQRLIKLLQQAPYPVTITQDGSPGFDASLLNDKPNSGVESTQTIEYLLTLRKSDYRSNQNKSFSQFGAGGYVKFHPMAQVSLIESDDQSRIAPPEIILAHELFHAFDGVRGLMDRRFVDGQEMQFTSVNEYRATYFENQIRKASKLKYRKHYGSERNRGSLLDARGEPYLLPAPCLP